jgi:hypothetical protein
VEIELEHGIERFEELAELMFRKVGKEIMKDVGIYYRNEFEQLKR